VAARGKLEELTGARVTTRIHREGTLEKAAFGQKQRGYA